MTHQRVPPPATLRPEHRLTFDATTRTRFKWNATAIAYGYVVPARWANFSFVHLHPSHVEDDLLRELNPGKSVPWVPEIQTKQLVAASST